MPDAHYAAERGTRNVAWITSAMMVVDEYNITAVNDSQIRAIKNLDWTGRRMQRKI